MSSTASAFGCADPRSLLVGILVLAKRPLTPPDIIALGYVLRLSAANIKSHLTRLSAEGVSIRTGSRRSQIYSLSAGRGRLVERIAACSPSSLRTSGSVTSSHANRLSREFPMINCSGGG